MAVSRLKEQLVRWTGFLTSPRRIRNRLVWMLRRFVLGPYAFVPGTPEVMTAQTLEGLGLALKGLGLLDEAADLLGRATAANPAAINSHRYLAEVFFRQRQTEPALAAILRCLDIPLRDRSFSLADPVRLDFVGTGAPAPLPAPPRRITVVTSLMPRRLGVQQAAVASWRALGFEVISVNPMVEQEPLLPLFPSVRFVQPSATAEHLCGRPLVMIDALFDVLATAEGDLCGVINSDIVIGNDPAFRRAIEAHVADSLVFGHRIDLDDARILRREPFVGGYDFFFFDKTALPLFRGTNLVLGMPWWDFWMPLAAWLGGLAVKRLDAPMVMHLVHPVGYRPEFFCSFSREFIAAADRLIDRFAATGLTQSDVFVRRLYHSLAAYAAASPTMDATRAGSLCAFTNFLINTHAGTITTIPARHGEA